MRRSLGVAIAMGGVLAVTGCSGSDSSSGDASPGEAAPSTTAGPSTTAAPSQPQSLSDVSTSFYGGTIRAPFAFGPDASSASIIVEMLPGQVGPNIIHLAFLDQGQRAVPIQDLQLGLRSSKGTTPLPAAPLEDSGHFATQVTFARPGSWELSITFKPSPADDVVTQAVPVSVQ